MKKILLIPTALAVTSAPIISLSGCSNSEKPFEGIEMDVDIDVSTDRKHPLLKTEPFSIQVGTPYRFNVDLSKDKTFEKTSEYITFWITQDEATEEIADAEYDISSFIVDSVALEFDSEHNLPEKPGTYTLYKRSKEIIVGAQLTKKMTAKSTSVIDLTFTSDDSGGKVFFYFENSET